MTHGGSIAEEAVSDEVEGHSLPSNRRGGAIVPTGANAEDLRLVGAVIKELTGGRWKRASEIGLILPLDRSLQSVLDAVRKHLAKGMTFELDEHRGGGLALRIVKRRAKKEKAGAEQPPPTVPF